MSKNIFVSTIIVLVLVGVWLSVLWMAHAPVSLEADLTSLHSKHETAQKELLSFKNDQSIAQAKPELEEKARYFSTHIARLLEKLRALENSAEVLTVLDTSGKFSLRGVTINLPSAEKYKKTESELNNAKSRYKSKHPRIKSLEAQLEVLKKLLIEEIYEERIILKTQKKQFTEALTETQSEMARLIPWQQEYERLEEEVRVADRQLQETKQRQESFNSLGESSLKKFFYVNKQKLARGSLFFGSLYLLVLVFLSITHLKNPKISHPRHVTRLHNTPLLAVLPRVKKVSPLYIHEKPQSPYGESLALIRNQLLNSADTYRVITLATTALEVPLKLATNMAISLAHAQKKVLLIDCHTEHPRQHVGFRIVNTGLAEALNHRAELEKCIHKVVVPNLHVLPAGSGLLVSDFKKKEFQELLTQVRTTYDFVLLDGPSVAASTNSFVIATSTDGIILTVPRGKTSRKALESNINELKRLKIPLLGVVLKEVPERYRYNWNLLRNSPGAHA
ncbi:MAG TPA: AAA family ATPase [Bdellovibrionota bacterium]|nr:AAA family ATPase [Bdellovibrionota bacterium]